MTTIILPNDLLRHVRNLVDYTHEHDADHLGYALPSDVYDSRNRLETWLDALDQAVSDDEKDARDDLQPCLPIPLPWEMTDAEYDAYVAEHASTTMDAIDDSGEA